MAASSVSGRWSTAGWPSITRSLGLLKVEAVGTGFLMVSRDAVLAMFRAYPELKIDDWNVARSERPHLYDLFKDLYYDDPELEFGGRRRDGEDFSFCHRWRAIGGEVFVDPHAEMVHGNRTAQTKRLSVGADQGRCRGGDGRSGVSMEAQLFEEIAALKQRVAALEARLASPSASTTASPWASLHLSSVIL